ncbi:hypothetical protein ACLOJK_024211 [Asimina triloba]
MTHPRQRLPIFIQAPLNPSPWLFFSIDGQQQACSSSPHRLPRRPNPSPPLAPSSAVRPRAAHRLANESSTSITMPATPLSTRRRANPHLRQQLRPYLRPDNSISHHPSQIRPTNPSAVAIKESESIRRSHPGGDTQKDVEEADPTESLGCESSNRGRLGRFELFLCAI